MPSGGRRRALAGLWRHDAFGHVGRHADVDERSHDVGPVGRGDAVDISTSPERRERDRRSFSGTECSSIVCEARTHDPRRKS